VSTRGRGGGSRSVIEVVMAAWSQTILMRAVVEVLMAAWSRTVLMRARDVCHRDL
jgi:hypothetical protein